MFLIITFIYTSFTFKDFIYILKSYNKYQHHIWITNSIQITTNNNFWDNHSWVGFFYYGKDFFSFEIKYDIPQIRKS